MPVIDTQINQVDFRSAIPRKIPAGFPDAGKIAIIGFETRWISDSLLNGPASSYTWPYPGSKASATSHVFVSVDENANCWEHRGYLPHATPGRNDASESPIVFLPNGDWLAATYARETHDFISWYSAALYRSQDQGYTWQVEGFVGPRANPALPNDTTYLADEPFLLMLSNGTLLCMIRTLEEGRPASAVTGLTHHLWKCTNPTARGAMTWVDLGVKTFTWAGSRAPIYQHSSGIIVHHFRIVNNGGSGPGAYSVSGDEGINWATARFLDTGGVASNVPYPPQYSYGDMVELSNGYIGMVYLDEVPPPGGGSSPATRWATIQITGAPTTTVVGRSLAAPYPIRTPVGRSLPEPYTVVSHAARSLVQPYTVERDRATRSLDMPYAIDISVGRSLGTPYPVRLVTGRSLEMRSLTPAIYTTYATNRRLGPVQVEYQTLRTVAVGASFPRGRSLSTPYDIAPPVSKSLPMAYAITVVTSKSLGMDYEVQSAVGRSLPMSYRFSVGRSLFQEYSVIVHAGRSLSQIFYVTGAIGRSLDMAYQTNRNPTVRHSQFVSGRHGVAQTGRET